MCAMNALWCTVFGISYSFMFSMAEEIIVQIETFSNLQQTLNKLSDLKMGKTHNKI